MVARPQAIDDAPAAFAEVFRRLRAMDDAMRDRMLPPGYHYNIVGGNLVVTSPAGTTATLAFA